jgi:pimeloyl-ACP methyl ester carboxylesterase
VPIANRPVVTVPRDRRVRKHREILALLLVAPVAMTLAACSGVVVGTPVPVTVEKRGPTGSVPEGLERFYGQDLGWGDCLPLATGDTRPLLEHKGLECARMTAPLDYADPGGRTVSIALLRHQAGQRDRRVGALIVNPGGPGASGVTQAAALAVGNGNSELAARFDLVGFDPRGIGASEPAVRCLTDAERDADRLDNDLDTSPAGVAVTERENQDFVAKCVQRTGVDVLANLGTRDVARDMDVLRSALGEPKLTFLGYSYGTRLGTEYAERFPGNVRAMVLDGAVDPVETAVNSAVSQGRGFQAAFDTFARFCAGLAECPLGTDPTRAVSRFRALVNPLIDNAAPTRKGRRLSYQDAITATIQALYSEQFREPLVNGLTELAGGRGDTMLLLADTYYGRSTDGHYSTITDAFVTIHCVDDERITDRAMVAEADRRFRQAAPFTDDGRAPTSAFDPCYFWPVLPTTRPHRPDIPGLPPTLVVSTTGDPATPYQAGVRLAEQLGARLLTNIGDKHTAFLQDKKCVDDIGIGYLVELRLPDPGARCA